MENNIHSEPLNEWNMCRRENHIPFEPGYERNMCSKENVLLCDKCCRVNVKLSVLYPSGMRSTVQPTQMDHRNPSMSDNRWKIQKDYQKCIGSHEIYSLRGNYSPCVKGNREKPQEDYPDITMGYGLHSTSAYSSKGCMDLQCTCRITHNQSRSSLSGMEKSLSAHLSRLKCSQTRPVTYSNPNVINHVTTQKDIESIQQITYNRIEDTLSYSSPTVPRTQKDRYTDSKSDELTVFQLSDAEYLSHESKEFTQKLCDNQAFQASTKCSSAIPKCTLLTSESTLVPPFQHKISKQQQSLPSQCNPSGALFLHHSAVTFLKRTSLSCVFTNSMVIVLLMFTLLPLPAHSATNGIPCLYKGSLKSDRSWFGFLTNITIMNTGRMTFQFSYPAEKCCQNILFYLEDQVSILNARMNCWQKESLLRYFFQSILLALYEICQ